MVRSEIMPARFRNSFETPVALTPNTATEVNFRLQDVLHTFKKGHKIQIQVQSTCYPLFFGDRLVWVRPLSVGYILKP